MTNAVFQPSYGNSFRRAAQLSRSQAAPAVEVLLHLLEELRPVNKSLAFANAKDFAKELLDTPVVIARDTASVRFRELLQ